MQINSEDNFEAQVEPHHRQAIAQWCGLSETDVAQALKLDNESRRLKASETEAGNMTEDILWEDDGRFDPDSQDDLDDLDIADMDLDNLI